MQVASSAYPSSLAHAHYHSPYLSQRTDQELKRNYLALLPPQQIIEICLTFDVHVPPYVKSTVWPSDINAAIAALHKIAPPDNAPEDGLRKSVPHQPYGFSPSTAYPHNPYYPAHGTAFAYPHSPYTPYPPMQNGYHPHVPPAYPASSPAYNNLMPLPPPPEGVNADDLPSYEEMIVETLSSTTDPEGYAPKDLFAWMASRYPLQSNFRPSASQALQKAYRRGRFEKSSGGKYRLNPTWDGGNTLRRSTRRPQTQNSLSSGPPATASPFTKTPLVHHQQTPAPSNATATAARLPFPPYGYPYAHMGYPGVPPQPQPQPTPVASSPGAKQSPDHDSDSINAYEAAQTILKAINFGNLLQLPAEDSDDGLGANDHQSQQSGLETLLSHVQAALASSADATAAGPLPVAAPAAPAPPALSVPPTNLEPAVDPRAELQAQLALLAAQLAKLSQTEEATSIAQDVPPPVSTFVPTHDPPQIPPATPAIPDINPSGTQDDDDDDHSDDDDMEEII